MKIESSVSMFFTAILPQGVTVWQHTLDRNTFSITATAETPDAAREKFAAAKKAMAEAFSD